MKNLLTSFFTLFIFSAGRAISQFPADIALENFKLVGDLTNGQANFTLTAIARVENPKGGSLELLSGALALTQMEPHPKWTLRAEQNRFVADFSRRGMFPVQLKFVAAVTDLDGWHCLDFHV